MTFGPIMRVAHPEFDLTMAPMRRDDMPRLAAGLSQMSVSRYTVSLFGRGFTDEDANAKYEAFRTSSDIAWGIYVGDSAEPEARRLVGYTDAFQIRNAAVRTATTGTIIFEPNLWGRGIVTATHRARTWYLLHIVGFDALRSVYFSANEASGRALHRVGYVQTGLMRNGGWYAGEALHDVYTECVNPADAPWARWWGSDPVPAEFVEARQRTRAALAWADGNVTLL